MTSPLARIIAACCAVALLLGLMASGWRATALLPVAWALVLWAGLVVAFWLRTRGAVARLFGAEHRFRPLDAPPLLTDTAVRLTNELGQLGYQPAGWYTDDPDGEWNYVVFVHPGLPIFGTVFSATGRKRATGLPEAFCQLDTYFEGGGRLATSGLLSAGMLSSTVDTGAPRLVQLRKAGTPTALDGQHVGTVKAWMTGGRVPIPVSADAYVPLMTEDRARLTAALRSAGWITFPAYLRMAFGHRPGVLTF